MKRSYLTDVKLASLVNKKIEILFLKRKLDVSLYSLLFFRTKVVCVDMQRMPICQSGF